MNKKLTPDPRDLKGMLAPVPQIIRWIKARTGALIVGVGMLKGGTGKSTSVLYLALWFARVLNLKVCVVDTDTNSQSLANWYAKHEALGSTPPFAIVEHDVSDRRTPTLKKRIKELAPLYDVVLVDLGGGDKEAFVDLCEFGHLLFVPAAPSGWETSRVQPTLQTAASAARLNVEGLIVYMILVACDFNTSLPREQRAALEVDLSEIDDDFVPVPLPHPYVDVSDAVHYPRSWESIPKLGDLEEFSLLMRYAMVAVMEGDEE